MAVDTRVFCDKCGERITQDRTSLKIVCGPIRHREPVDLCSTCLAEFTAWLGPEPGRKGDEYAAAASQIANG